MYIEYYLDDDQTLFGYNDTYDLLRVYNKNENSWDRVTFSYSDLVSDRKLKRINIEEVNKITDTTPEESMLQSVRIIKSNMGDI